MFDEFIDATGPALVIVLCILAIYPLYLLVLDLAIRTKNYQFDSERRRIENESARGNSRLVTVTQQAALVSRAHVESGGLYGEMFDLLRADVDSRRLPQPVPQSLHWAPHIIDKRPLALPAPVELESNGAHVEPPSVMECFTRGLFSDPAKLLTGFEDGSMVYSEVERTYGVCVAGLPGMGKSNGMRFYALQMVLHGAQMAIIDPAANSASGEGLAASFEDHLWAPMAVEPDEIVELLRKINLLGQRRDSGRDTDLTPLLLLADEVTSLITDDEHGAEIKALLMRINRRYRKNKIYTIGAGQDWLAGAQGGDTSLRNTYVCKTIFRIDRANAGKLLPNPKLVPLAPELREGQAIFVGHDAVGHVIDIPYCPAQAVAAILGQNTQPRRSQVVEPLHMTLHKALPSALHEGNEEQLQEEGSEEANITLKIDKYRMVHVKQMITIGASNGQILREVWGLEKLAGKAYQQANRELQEIVRCLVTRSAEGSTDGR